MPSSHQGIDMGSAWCSKDCCLEYFVWICRFWGVVTAIGLWGVGVETSFRGNPLGYYILCTAGLVSFLETVFLINICIYLCIGEDQSLCIRCWKGVLWVDDWRRGLLYLLLSIGCFVQPYEVWLAVISGLMLVIGGVFYCLKTYKTKLEERTEAQREEENYDRFEIVDDDDDDFADDINNSLPRDMEINHQETDAMLENLAGQDEILEV